MPIRGGLAGIVEGQIGEGHIFIPPQTPDSVGQGTWALVISNDYQFNSTLDNRTTHADGDNCSFEVYLDKGTYVLLLFYERFTTRPIVDIDIEGVEVASVDQYGAAAQLVDKTTGISIASAGLKTLTIRVDGKNASSSDHKASMNGIILYRSAS